MSGGTLFSSEYCPGGQYSRRDIIHSDNVTRTKLIKTAAILVYSIDFGEAGLHGATVIHRGPRCRVGWKRRPTERR